MDFWWRVLSFFVLCHFCGSNGSKVRGLGILSSVNGFRAYSNAYKSLIKTNTGVLLDIRTIIGHKVKWTMSTWPPNFPHCALAHRAVANNILDELKANVWRQFMYIECILHVVMYVNEIIKFHFNFISTDGGDSKYYVWWFWPGQICRLKNNHRAT